MAEALGAEYAVHKVTKVPRDATETLFRGEPPLYFISKFWRLRAPPHLCAARFLQFQAVCSLCWPFCNMTLSRRLEAEKTGELRVGGLTGPPTKAQLGARGGVV